ncbi:MAG: hypothetical protein IJW06_02065 [Clostridia bacterium]|nr:hypothetical protein [Clostridia bacterium]
MYCRKCAKVIMDDEEYCSDCLKTINQQNSHAEEQKKENNVMVTDRRRKKCCPKCKSRNLQIITNTQFSSETTGGGYSAGKGCCGYMAFGPLGLLCGSCGSKTETTITSDSTTVWVCLECGNRFRDIEDVNKEIEATSTSIYTSSKSWTSIFLFAILFIIISAITKEAEFSFLILVAPIYLISLLVNHFLIMPYQKGKLERLEQEKRDIEKNGYIDE